ncbi:MAG TPA: hypothetical protein VGK67_08265 [Myxococcales bacterium]|jgi:hypothetical protein
MIRAVLVVVGILVAALVPGSALAAQKGAHIAMSCAFAADPFCNRLLAELQAAGHQVDKLPDGAALEAELAAPGAVVQVRQAPWEVVVMVRRDGVLETRTYKPDDRESNPAQTVAVQVAEGLRASFALRTPDPEVPRAQQDLQPTEEPKAAPELPRAQPAADSQKPAPEQTAPKSLRLLPREPSGKSELQIDLETYFATAGFQLLMNASVLGSVAFFVAIGIIAGSSINWGVIAIGAIVAPIVLALPSSHLAYKMASRDSERTLAFSKGFLAASVASTVLVGGTMALLLPGFSNSPELLWSGVALYAASAFLVPAAEVLTLKYTAVQVVAAPMAIKGGGGISVAFVF